jgi:hypothetical protein
MSTVKAFHPLAEIFPPMEGSDFEALVADIKAHGLHEPIVVLDDQILDGRNRYRACLAAGVDPTFAPYRGDDAAGYVVSLNVRRRHLDESQRAMVAAKLATLKRGDNQHSPIGETSQAKAAQLLNVGKRSVERAAEVHHHGALELQQAVERGAVSVSAAADVASLPTDQQRQIVAGGDRKILRAAKQIRGRKAKRTRRRQPGNIAVDPIKNPPLAAPPEAASDLAETLVAAWDAASTNQRHEFVKRHKVEILAVLDDVQKNTSHIDQEFERAQARSLQQQNRRES